MANVPGTLIGAEVPALEGAVDEGMHQSQAQHEC